MIPDIRPDDWQHLPCGTLDWLETPHPAPKLLDLAQQLQGPDSGPAWDDEEEDGGGPKAEAETDTDTDTDTDTESEPEGGHGLADAEVKSATARTAGPQRDAPLLNPSRPDRKTVTPLRLHALARLCRTFGRGHRIRALVRPGAVTLITCADPSLLEDQPEALRTLLRSVTGLDSCDAQKADAARTGYCLLIPHSGKDALARGAREDVARSLRRALERNSISLDRILLRRSSST